MKSKHFENWDEYYLTMAYMVAMRSKDNSTWIGAVIVGPDGEIRSTGYNGFPRGVEYLEERLQRPAKYDYTEHGERNAIYNAARAGIATKGCTMYTHGLPCVDCARGVVQSGISRVITSKHGLVASYSESVPTRLQILEEGGVEFIELDFDPSGSTIQSFISGRLNPDG
jgi:dCMP deaminase